MVPMLNDHDLSSLRTIICGGSAVPKVAVRGVARGDRHSDHAGVGHDRDLAARAPSAIERSRARRRARGRARPTCAPASASARPASRCASSTPTPARNCRGTTRRPARSSAAARGSPSSTTAPTSRASSSRPTAGCAPATSPRICPLGYVRLVDRTKDLVKSGGEWISSVALENEIMGHPKVAEAAVIAVPHPKWSERPLACVVVKDGEHARRARKSSTISPNGLGSGRCPTMWSSSTRSRRPASESSRRRPCATSSPTTSCRTT